MWARSLAPYGLACWKMWEAHWEGCTEEERLESLKITTWPESFSFFVLFHKIEWLCTVLRILSLEGHTKCIDRFKSYDDFNDVYRP